MTNPLEPIAPIAASTEQIVEVLSSEVRIHDLCIERPAIIAYLQTIQASKQSIALVHALEVGVTELIARRERFNH